MKSSFIRTKKSKMTRCAKWALFMCTVTDDDIDGDDDIDDDGDYNIDDDDDDIDEDIMMMMMIVVIIILLFNGFIVIKTSFLFVPLIELKLEYTL